MYDNESERLIRNAPPLSDLDVEALADELSSAFALIVAYRSRIREGNIDPLDSNVPTERLYRLATTYESYVSLCQNSEHREAAAFVSATAYQLLWLERIGVEESGIRTYLLPNCVSTDVSATLLFLIAGYSGDATEASNRLGAEGQRPVCAEIIAAVKLLAQGKLLQIQDIGLPEIEFIPQEEQAIEWLGASSLYREILLGIKQLAAQLLGNDGEPPADTFRRVMNLAVSEIELVGGSNAPSVVDSFAGPHHLASLLLQVSDSLSTGSIMRVPPPSGVPSARWRSFLAEMALRRPFIWRNHRIAIEARYLDSGVSAAVSFPTGAGKSTLSELKIASAVFAGGKALFLVPTHALVSQVLSELKRSFPDLDVRGTALTEGEYSETEVQQLPDIAVLTPERCLTQLGIAPESFNKLRLVVFDECHLLHPNRGVRDRRSLDAMFCMLSLFDNAPNADFALLSAMMQNAEEISSWIASATERECLALELDWKPTRQVRGCLVYDQTILEQMQNRLHERRKAEMARTLARIQVWDRDSRERKGKRPTLPAKPKAADKRNLSLDPKILFCLKQTWAGKNYTDYKLVPFLTDPLELSINNSWNLTSNRNNVAVAIGRNFSKSGIKTLIFGQNRVWVEKISREIGEGNSDSASFVFSEEEQRYLDISKLEAGGEAHIYQPTNGTAACHHGLLLPSERQLNESAFTRRDGIMVLAATPTLAQGINLPAEAVIMAGDDRFDKDTGYNSQLLAHELLNAAGRAGRAGYVSNGVVLVIPGENVGLNTEKVQLSNRWFELKESFANPDKCLAIEDPIDVFVDLLQNEIEEADQRNVEYFLTRLPTEKDGLLSNRLLAKTLAAHKAQAADKIVEFQKKILTVQSKRQQILAVEGDSTWKSECSFSTGVPVSIIENLSESIEGLSTLEGSVEHWIDWYFDWLETTAGAVDGLVSSDTLDAASKAERKPANVRTPHETLALLRHLVRIWVHGGTLAELALEMGAKREKLGYCPGARKFVTQWLRNLVYGMGLIALVIRKNEESKWSDIPTELAVLASCVKEGFLSSELLALSYSTRTLHARSEIRTLHKELLPILEAPSEFENFFMTRDRFANAIELKELVDGL